MGSATSAIHCLTVRWQWAEDLLQYTASLPWGAVGSGVFGVLGRLTPVHQGARSVCCPACAVSLASWLPFTGVPAPCAVCAMSLANLLPFICVPVRCVVMCVRLPWPLGSRSPVCPLGVLCCVCGVLGHFTPVHQCARLVCSLCSVPGHLGLEVSGLMFQVQGVLGPLGATWSGQVISSPAGPSGGPFMTHPLPGGRVPRVHGAQSPAPLRLPHFATSRSVRHSATVVAGAYPLRRPPDAWSPGVPTSPGRCYWVVASGTPMDWRGGCLAVGLVRGTVCHYCLGGCSALIMCARCSRQVWWLGPVLVPASLQCPPAFPRVPSSV